MDTRKVTLIVSVVLIALLAVGIGYAYTAMTVNQGNNAAPEFITLTQGNDYRGYTFTYDEDTANTDVIYWDSVNYANGTSIMNDYTLTSKVTTLTLTDGVKYTTVQVGKDITLYATQDAGAIKESINIALSTLGFKIDASENLGIIIKAVYAKDNSSQFFKVTSTDVIKGYSSTATGDKWVADPVLVTEKNDDTEVANDYYGYTISVFFGYPESAGKYVKTGDVTAKPINKPLQNAKIMFRASTDKYNDGGSKVTSFSIRAANNATSVAVNADLQLTAEFSEGSNTSVVVWYSSDDSKATVDSTGKVHGVAATTGTEKVIITAQTTDGAVSKTIELTVASP